jgi:hypothetical protein
MALEECYSTFFGKQEDGGGDLILTIEEYMITMRFDGKNMNFTMERR